MLVLPIYKGRGGCHCYGFNQQLLFFFFLPSFLGLKFKLFPHSILCKAASEANLDLSFDWRGRDVAEEELLEELPDLEDMEDLLAQLIH